MNNESNSSHSSYEPLRRLISDAKISELRSQIKVRADIEDIDWNEKTIPLSSLEQSFWKPQLIIAIDGDYSKQSITNGFPGAEVGYITISTVVILMDKLKKLENSRFVDPKLFRETEKTRCIDSLIVGCNVVLNGETSAKSTMRRILFNKLKEEKIFDNTETLLDTYEHLLKIKRERGNSNAPDCPNDNCDAKLEDGYGEYTCKSCGGKLYSTDALRLHELMKPSGTNGEMYGQIMETIKKLQLIHLLRSFEQTEDWFTTLKNIAFFMEGTLAVFSSSSWLAKCFRIELERINSKVKENCGQDLLIMGIERTGNFVNHFEDIDTQKDGRDDNFPNQSAFLLTNDYIKNNIVLNENPDFIYLKDTSFGRKFFYKTKSGYRVVPSIATFSNYQSEVSTAYTAQFPRLADCLALLDKLVSARYNNSVMPLATAHSEAAIPLNLGKTIFDEIAREIRANSSNND
ncbi:NurA domain-containing protein [Flavobacterium endophyticum]|uniref:NurA domain-containing protein n=1 Tax=Flavobacterium endophyticum TaxID=1540163 RepID=A0A495M6X6_9FLAO|nr:DNA double-strand break repair nuclease NurA [Flavobacterium endophyticum]RKS20403.1 NurA domain-containing protein [Flavobacterium endophyticum]